MNRIIYLHCNVGWTLGPLPPVYRFGPFRYDPAQRLLFRGDELIQLVPKAVDTLHVLLEHRGRVVEKNDLMKAVWPDCVVEEIGLARNISLLRKALGDEAGTYIETIPKRGYRFAAGVEELAAPPYPHVAIQRRRSTWLIAAAVLFALCAVVYWQFYRPSRFLPQTGGTANLAVIPLDYLSPDLRQSALSEAFTEVLIEETTSLKSARVISPATVARYRRLRIPTAIMARLLGLDVVVEGTAQTFGSQLRISLRLTDVHSGRLIWAGRYDLNTADLSQAEITAARSATADIARSLAPRQP